MGAELDGFEAVVEATNELRVEIDHRHCEERRSSGDRVFQVLRELHADAVLVGSEVVILLRHGLPSAALARWRSLHELNCSARAVRIGGQEIAFRHLEHEVLRERRFIVQLHRLSKKHEKQTTPGSEVARGCQVEITQLLESHEPEFGGEMGWAHPLLLAKDPEYLRRWERGERPHGPSIADVRRFTDLDIFSGDYMAASFSTHASSKARHLYASGLTNVEIIGPITTGIEVAAISSAQALRDVADQMVLHLGDHDAALQEAALVLSYLARDVVEAFQHKASELIGDV